MLFWCEIVMPYGLPALAPNSSMQGLVAFSVTSSCLPHMFQVSHAKYVT